MSNINQNENVEEGGGYYSIIPQSAYWELSGNAIKVYGFYKSVSINKNDSFYCIEKIRKVTGLSYETIIKCKKELIDKKYISIKKRFNGTDKVTLLHKNNISILEFLDNDNDNLIENSSQFSENPNFEKSEFRENRISEKPNAVFGKSELQFSENPNLINNNLSINKLSREEVERAPLSEPKKSTYENINSEYNEFERYIVSHYVELTGKPIMDIRQIPEFKNEQGRQVLRTAFDNRKNDWGKAIDNALNSTSKSNREFRWLDFMKSLYLNLASVSEKKEPPKTEKQLKREKLYEALKNRFGEVWEERYKNAWKPNGTAIDQEFSDFYFEVAIALGLY